MDTNTTTTTSTNDLGIVAYWFKFTAAAFKDVAAKKKDAKAKYDSIVAQAKAEYKSIIEALDNQREKALLAYKAHQAKMNKLAAEKKAEKVAALEAKAKVKAEAKAKAEAEVVRAEAATAEQPEAAAEAEDGAVCEG